MRPSHATGTQTRTALFFFSHSPQRGLKPGRRLFFSQSPRYGDSNPDGAIFLSLPPLHRGLKSGWRCYLLFATSTGTQIRTVLSSFSPLTATTTGDSNPDGAASSQSRHLTGDSYPDGGISLLLGHLFRLPASGRPHFLPRTPLHHPYEFCTARFSQEVVLVNIFPLFYDSHQAPSTEQSWT
jgi:hypothetical protein